MNHYRIDQFHTSSAVVLRNAETEDALIDLHFLGIDKYWCYGATLQRTKVPQPEPMVTAMQ